MKNLLLITTVSFLHAVTPTSAGQKQLDTFTRGVICDEVSQVKMYLRTESALTSYVHLQPKTVGCKFVDKEMDVKWEALFRYDDGIVSATVTEMDMPDYGLKYGFFGFKSPPDDEL
jgi:hypothetical protein